MRERPLVSVVIPNYNHARFLDERIQSVLDQTYTHFEIIILDDNSTDASGSVIEKYRDNPKVSHIIFNEENSGSTFAQWHKGIEVASGSLVWIAESDDSCAPALLETLVEAFVEDPDCAYSFCRSRKYYLTGLHHIYHYQKRMRKSFRMDGKEFIKKYLHVRNRVVNASSVVFSKEKALSVDRCYMDYKAYGDWLFWILLAEKGNVAFNSQALNHFRRHSSNTTKKMLSAGINILENRKIVSFLFKHHYMSNLDYFSEKVKALSSIRRHFKDNVKERKEMLEMWEPNLLANLLSWLQYDAKGLSICLRKLTSSPGTPPPTTMCR